MVCVNLAENKAQMKTYRSFISKQEILPGECIRGRDIREGVLAMIQTEHPDFSANDVITVEELNRYRRFYLTSLVEQEKGEVAALDKEVIKAIRENSILSRRIGGGTEPGATLGQRLADRIADFGGSWTFILSFLFFILVWITINSWLLMSKSFDPYPFILLNLILSTLAALQAPVIMMSQNRQEEKDRERAEHDYKINLKAELEIRLLSEKIDHLLVDQNKKLLEIQAVQIDYLEDLMKQQAQLKPSSKTEEQT